MSAVSKAHIVYVVSDHGFGHAARSSTVIAELLRRHVDVTVVSSVPKWFFDEGTMQGGV
jgi:cell division GTPase FtsZ